MSPAFAPVAPPIRTPLAAHRLLRRLELKDRAIARLAPMINRIVMDSIWDLPTIAGALVEANRNDPIRFRADGGRANAQWSD